MTLKEKREHHQQQRATYIVGTMRGYLESISPRLREGRIVDALLVPQARWVNDHCLRSATEPVATAAKSLAKAERYRAALAAALAAANASCLDAKCHYIRRLEADKCQGR